MAEREWSNTHKDREIATKSSMNPRTGGGEVLLSVTEIFRSAKLVPLYSFPSTSAWHAITLLSRNHIWKIDEREAFPLVPDRA
jgi:hypothetical protein